jgi:NAD(P)-dependent dehydrogenase (short-subunit alcohol dehydrogenase family)
MGFLYSQFFVRPTYPTGSYGGKTVIVTGSNVGLGKEAARHFARLGASRLILAVRSLDRGYAAKADIEATTRCDKDVIQVWQIDMGSYASVKKFAARVDAELDRVDIVIANAGVARLHYSVVEDNEEQITVNVVSTFLLTALLMPKLKATAARFNVRPNFSITTSEAHTHTDFPQRTAPESQLFATINDKETALQHWSKQYPLSKMLEVFAVRAIGEKYPAEGFPVTINCLNPGLCHTELARDSPTWGFWFFKLIVARTAEVGSRTLVDAGSQGVDTHGEYLSDCRIAVPAALITSPEGKIVQENVWTELTQQLERIQPGVMKNF